MLSSLIDELILRLDLRQRRRLEPMLPPLPVSLTAGQTIAAIWLVAIFAAARQVTVLSPYRYLAMSLTRPPGPWASLTQEQLWAMVTYSGVVLICSGFSLVIWREKRIRSDPRHPTLG
jgi:hypothetical protein